ncbi:MULTISPECIES: hemerythrin domain-containing protein [Streptomyces]|uniref:DNA nickase n=1 Tax=Streptomyces griseorubiginosus TaxID=67304 RepID=A0A101S5U5_9ACTN|nr:MULTISPECIES: hemerythrin domain-containing protein [Streptomyces]AYC37017.1 DNA nickase [Streptomyces griseorubiginosus]KUN68000.1 hemerythrin [Streptomyces griseorubiginosus]TCR20192.1 hemerythrin HHE cation binding domain-containing protein [Streptomyces sp. BK205]
MAGIAASDADVVALLMRQHGEIRNLFDRVEGTAGDERRAAFRELVRLLAVHETAEEEVIRPFTRTSVPDGGKVADERLAEEREAKELLSRLDGMDADDPKFLPELRTLRLDVMRHARAEERYEFNHVRRHADKARLASMATALRAAEAVAPTRPHPGTESAAKNLTLGPVTALVDRTRDAVRKAMGKDG